MRILAAFLIFAGLLAGDPPRVELGRVRIPVWTNSAEPLTREAIIAKANGQPAEVLHVKGPGDDLLLLIVLDMVGGVNEIELARAALSESIGTLPPNVWAGVLRAQDGLRVLLDPTTDHDAVISTIASFPITGTPGLLETIETAAELGDNILAKIPVRLAVLYVTDSDIRRYREDFTNPVINYSDDRDLSRRFPEGLVRERITKLAAKLGAGLTPVFVVHLERSPDQLNEAYQNGLMQLTAATGGDAVICRSNGEIAPAISDMLRRISGHYGVDLQISQSSGESAEIALESPGAVLRYRSRVLLRRK